MVLVWDICDLQLPLQLAGDTFDYGVRAVTSCAYPDDLEWQFPYVSCTLSSSDWDKA